MLKNREPLPYLAGIVGASCIFLAIVAFDGLIPVLLLNALGVLLLVVAWLRSRSRRSNADRVEC